MSTPSSTGTRRPVETITVVTPCFNSVRYIEETVDSVIHQRAVKEGRLKLNYWVIDGGSTDGTQAILQRYADQGLLHFISEKDNGMYDAIIKGLKQASGEVCCYINAGDYFHLTAFDVVKEVMDAHDVPWLSGWHIMYNDRSQVINFYLQKRFFRSFIRKGIYGRLQPHIQQESTFWRTELLELLDYDKLRSYRFAGDFYLWHSFASKHELVVVASQLGGFKLHPGQLSSAVDKYTAELAQISGHHISWWDRVVSQLDLLAAKLPSRKMLVPMGYERVIRWDRENHYWAFPQRR
jgi:glycosyltransferase involved in cell wall biosynthesis